MKATTKLTLVLCISLAFFCTEVAIGFKTHSLTLQADAFHYLSDLISYVLAYVAARLGEKGKRSQKYSYAYKRAELVGAFFNGTFLLALALSIFLQALSRFVQVEVITQPVEVLIVGCIGLALNIVSALVLHDHPHEEASDDEELAYRDPSPNDFHSLHNHVNMPKGVPKRNEGLFAVTVHVIGDAVNNIGVIFAAIIVWKLHSPQRYYVDPAVSIAIALIIFASAIPLTLRTSKVLLQATPTGVNVDSLLEDLKSVEGVKDIHDLHIWQLSQSNNIATLHCCAAYHLDHVTIAPELEGDEGVMPKKACEDGVDCV